MITEETYCNEDPVAFATPLAPLGSKRAQLHASHFAFINIYSVWDIS